jgi:chromosome segregation ATPase
LDEAKEEAKQLKSEVVKKLQKQHIASKDEIEKIGAKLKEIDNEIASIKKSINESVKNGVSEYDAQLSRLDVTLINTVTERQNEFRERQEKINEELQEALKESGIDESQLISVSKEIERLKSKLAKIDANRKDVLVYISEYREKIQTIPTLHEKLERDKNYLIELNTTKKRVVKENDLQKEVYKKDKDALKLPL